MITYVRASIFESPAQVLVNTVNTVGVMGKGIALQFKRLFPQMFKEYQRLCEDGRLEPGSLHLYRTPGKWVLNFATKEHWRNLSQVEYIEKGLKAFVSMYAEAGVVSIAFPPLGCGNGQLDFRTQVRPLMEKYLRPLPIAVFIYPEKAGDCRPEHEDIKAMREWLHTEPESLPFGEMWPDLVEILRRKQTFRTFAKGSQFQARVTKTLGPAQLEIHTPSRSSRTARIPEQRPGSGRMPSYVRIT